MPIRNKPLPSRTDGSAPVVLDTLEERVTDAGHYPSPYSDIVALLVLGDRRPFPLRPRSHRNAHGLADRGATHDIAPGHGDLLVMGGACQMGWEHAVPPVRGPVGGRLSVQWRWTSRTGRPFEGGSWRAPLTYDR